jgi:hypothetical protein
VQQFNKQFSEHEQRYFERGYAAFRAERLCLSVMLSSCEAARLSFAAVFIVTRPR